MLVISMICTHNMKVSNYVDCAVLPQLKEEYFLGINRLLNHMNIENTIQAQIEGDNTEDAMNFVTLYLSHAKLLGVGNRNIIKDHFLHLVKDLDAFNHYPWGLVVWNKIVKSICEGIHKKYKYCL